jgi:periplasmic protein TonB
MGAALPETPALANERFGFTLFVSLCVHAVLILGVGFGVSELLRQAPSLEITLAQYRSQREPDQADFLAQENQEGSGSMEEASAPSTDVQALFNDNQIRDAMPLIPETRRPDTQPDLQQVVLASRGDTAPVSQQHQEEAPLDSVFADDITSEASITDTIASLQAQLDLQRQAYAKRPRKYTLSSASTRQSRDALYLDSWRKKIEAVGNLNYPQQASAQRLYGTLRLMVALRPDGSVSEIRVLSSSGHRVLDDAGSPDCTTGSSL